MYRTYGTQNRLSSNFLPTFCTYGASLILKSNTLSHSPFKIPIFTKQIITLALIRNSSQNLMNNYIKSNIAPWTIYPLVMSSAILLFFIFRNTGGNSIAATYISIVFPSLSILLFELYLPYKKAILFQSTSTTYSNIFLIPNSYRRLNHFKAEPFHTGCCLSSN